MNGISRRGNTFRMSLYYPRNFLDSSPHLNPNLPAVKTLFPKFLVEINGIYVIYQRMGCRRGEELLSDLLSLDIIKISTLIIQRHETFINQRHATHQYLQKVGISIMDEERMEIFGKDSLEYWTLIPFYISVGKHLPLT